MAPKTSRTKIGLAIACLGVALILAWVVVDPLSYLVILLDVAKEVNVDFNTKIPVSATIDKNIDVQMPPDLRANVLINQRLAIPVNEILEVPIDMNINAPVKADVLVDQVLDLNVDIPIDVVLTEKELNVEKLQIPLDTELFIDDTLQIETKLPVDTTVKSLLGIPIPVKGTIPVKMAVPIKQKIRVKDEITVGVKQFRAPLKIVVPIRAQVPVKQMLHVEGTVSVPIRQTLPIQVRQVVNATLPDAIPVSISMDKKLPIALKAAFDTDVKITGTVPIQLGTLSFKKGAVRVVKGK